ncbi:MAG: hypothetical protein ACYS80_13005, partial [Planctomycetota bacterium]
MGNIEISGISKIRIHWIACLILLAYSTGYANVEKEQSEIALGTFTVNAGNYDRINTPIRFRCSPNEIFGDFSGFRR